MFREWKLKRLQVKLLGITAEFERRHSDPFEEDDYIFDEIKSAHEVIDIFEDVLTDIEMELAESEDIDSEDIRVALEEMSNFIADIQGYTEEVAEVESAADEAGEITERLTDLYGRMTKIVKRLPAEDVSVRNAVIEEKKAPEEDEDRTKRSLRDTLVKDKYGKEAPLNREFQLREKKTVVSCIKCGGLLRVPSDRGKGNVRCPKCGLKWEWSPQSNHVSLSKGQFDVLKQAAQNGVSAAQFEVGKMYITGRYFREFSLPQNKDYGRKLVAAAAKQGHRGAQEYLKKTS